MNQTKSIRPRRTTRLRVILAISAVLLVQACADSATGPGGETWSGSLVLQDAWGNDLDDFSGVAVSVDGLSLQAVSDPSGSWHIDGVPSGRHDVTFKKQGFGTMRVFGRNATGNATTEEKLVLASTPTFQALIDSIHVSTLSGIEFYFVDGHFTAPPPASAKSSLALIFLSRNDSVSPDPATYEQWNGSFSVSGGLREFTMALPVVGTRSTFGAGTQLFVAGYASSVACSCYNDPATGKRVFSNTGPRGNVVRFTVK